MGLSEDKLTGLLRIDRAAIPDRALAASSDKYDTTKASAAKQSPKVESLHFLESVRSSGQSLTKLWQNYFLEQRIFFGFLLAILSVACFVITRLFLRVSLTLGHGACHLAHALPMSSSPLLHLDII